MDTRKRRKEAYLQNKIPNILLTPRRPTRVHAQRKFASTSGPTAPLKELEELKEKVSINNGCKSKDQSYVLPNQPKDNATMRPKTEDFLTFLCFRGTSVLPPHLECFESPQYTKRWAKPKVVVNNSQDDKSYKSAIRKGKEEIFKKETAKECIKRNLEPIHVDVGSCTPARVTRSSASLTPTPSFLSSPRSSECSPNNLKQRKLTRNQMLLKKAMLIKSKKALAKERNTRIILKKKTKAKDDSARVTRSGVQPCQSVTQQASKSPIMACRKTVKASHVSKRKKNLCRMLKRIGIMADSSSPISRKTRSQSDVNRVISLPKRLDSQSRATHVEPEIEAQSRRHESPNLLKQKSRKRRQLTPNCSMSPTDSPQESRPLGDSLGGRSLVDKQKINLIRLAARSKSADVNYSEQHLSRMRKCVRKKTSSPAGIKHHDSELNLKGRPARRTKQVAEVYLELVSQKLAKEAEVGMQVSDEEDNISISSIKELKAVTKAKHKLDMKKCVKEFVDKHDGQKGSPVKTPSPVMRSRSNSESSPIKRHIVKRSLFHSDTEDSESTKCRVSKTTETFAKSKFGSEKTNPKSIEPRTRCIKVEPNQTEVRTKSHVAVVPKSEEVARPTVRLSRLKSPKRNSTSSKSDEGRSNDSKPVIAALPPPSKVKVKLKVSAEPSVATNLRKSSGNLGSVTSSIKKAGVSSKIAPTVEGSLRKVRSEKEIRRMATEFLDSRTDLPLPIVKKKNRKLKQTASNIDKVLNKKNIIDNGIHSCNPGQMRVRRALSLDEASSSHKLVLKESSLGKLTNNKSFSISKSSSKLSFKIDSANTFGKSATAKPRKKPLRRKSLHDNTQLSAVLEKIAKDFEKQIDIGACSKIETDLNAGNKSPDPCLKSESEGAAISLPAISNLTASSTLSIQKVLVGTKNLDGVVQNLKERSRGAKVTGQEKVVKDTKEPSISNGNKKVSEVKNQSHYSDSTPAQCSSPLREIQPKPISNQSDCTNQHCTPLTPIKNICSEAAAISERLPITPKLAEPCGSRENLKCVPYIAKVPSPMLVATTPESKLAASQSLKIPFTTHGIVLGGTATLGMPICQLQQAATIPPTLGHIAPGIAISQPIITSISDVKPTKIDLTPTKTSSKQILIAPKPSKNMIGNISNINPISGIKHYQKPIAPKVVKNNGAPVTVSHYQGATPLLAQPAMASLVQTLQHPIQAVQTVPQTLHAMQSLPQAVQSIQTLNQNYQAIGAVQGVMSHNPLNTAHLGSASSPAKLITPPVFVSSSVPNMVGTPFDFTMGQLPVGGMAPSMARVMTQNVVGKVVPKNPSVIPTSASQLVTLGAGADGSILSPFVPFNRPGQPQFLAVSMMPIVTTSLSCTAAGIPSAPTTLPSMVSSHHLTAIAPNLSVVSNSVSAVSLGSTEIPSTKVSETISSASLMPPTLVKNEPVLTKPTALLTPCQPSVSICRKSESDILVNSDIGDIETSETKKNSLELIVDENVTLLSTVPSLSEKNGNVSTSKSDSSLIVPSPCQPSSSVHSASKPSLALSRALSKLYPMAETATIPTSFHSTSYNSLQINTHIYTSASLISPQSMECGFSRQKAVTQVSQSSPPYLLSTSSSDAHKMLKVPVYKRSEAKPETKSVFVNKTDNSSSSVCNTAVAKSASETKNCNLKTDEKVTSKGNQLPLLSTKLFYSAKNKIQFNRFDRTQPPSSDQTENTLLVKESKLIAESNISTIDNNAIAPTTSDSGAGSNIKPNTICDRLSVSHTISSNSQGSKAPASCSKPIPRTKPSSMQDKKTTTTYGALSVSNITTSQSSKPLCYSNSPSIQVSRSVPPTKTILNQSNLHNSHSTPTFNLKRSLPSCNVKSTTKYSNSICHNPTSTPHSKPISQISSIKVHHSKSSTKPCIKTTTTHNNTPITSDHCKLSGTQHSRLNSATDYSPHQKSIKSPKKEPLLRKTLLKHKSVSESKSADAFSVLNESSVYAFEPDMDGIDVATPFVKRLKKINSTEEVCIAKKVGVSDKPHPKEDHSNPLQPAVKPSTTSGKVDIPKKSSAPNRYTKLGFSQIEASAKMDLSSASSIDASDDEEDVPVEIVSIAPVYSNSSAEEELITDLTLETIKQPVSSLGCIAKPKEKVSNSLRSVRLNQPVIERIPPPITASLKSLQNMATFKPMNTSRRRRRTVARIPMNRSLDPLMNRFPPNSIQSVSSANSILTSKPPIEVNASKLKSNSETMTTFSRVTSPGPVSKPPSNLMERRKSPIKQNQEKNKTIKKSTKKAESSAKGSKNCGKSGTKQPVQSTSIAIQCDLDDNSNHDEVAKPNESGTQTEGPAKLPLPPSASPFYYLPLAMATLGEELPAQLVQQMLAKTQGLVGETEAKMILRQAAQLAQQYHKNIDAEGAPSLPAASSAKPISPKSGNLALQKVLKATFSQAGLASLEKSTVVDANKGDSSKKPVNCKPSSQISTNKSVESCSSAPKAKIINAPPEMPAKLSSKSQLDSEDLKVDDSSRSSIETNSSGKRSKNGSNPRPSKRQKLEAIVKRRSGRSTTSASTKATEFDINEAEEIRRNRRARRAAASFARDEGWSSSSDAPLSPTMSPDSLRGWPPTRLTSPTPSQSSEGTTSSTPRRGRLSMPHSRKPSPVVPRLQKNYAPHFPTDPVIDPGPLLLSDSHSLTRAPSFFPTEDEFNEPLDYIEKIRPEAEHFGLCRIVPPGNFRPECRVNDDMRFAACKQYIHRVMNRRGRHTKVMSAIRKCLANQKIELVANPLIGSLELDLVRLYEVVEDMGGLMRVIESELWAKVADTLRIPKSTQDRLTKLDSIYCKYLLPYAMLSEDERKKLLDEVDEAHKKDDSRKDNHSDDEDDDIDEFTEFVVNGKSTSLSAFYRLSKNVASQWQPDTDGLKIDERYWNIVEGERHVCVHAASIDTAEHGYGFPSQKNSPSAKHPWNLKNVCQNPSSILRSMANVIGVSAPTLHIGMMFSTVCWYRDPHSLPWIEYLHTGSRKIWYSVPTSQENSMKEALTEIVPEFVKDSPLWLPSDATMIPPDLLIAKGIKVGRIAQEPGQFVVVFPGAFTSSVCSGYVISESAFYARPQYFSRAAACFKTLRECCEPAMFSLDRLCLSVAGDSKASLESLQKARCLVEEIVQREKKQRKRLTELGLKAADRMPHSGSYKKKKGRYFDDDEENLCEVCKQHLYVSMIFDAEEEIGYCLEHAISHLEAHPDQLQLLKLVYTFTLPELTSTLKQMDERISLKGAKKGNGNSAKRPKLSDTPDSYSSTSGSNF